MFVIVEKIDRLIGKISESLLIVSILGMLFFTLLTIVCRWFGVTFLWVDPFVRHLVFLSAFLGGVLATGRGTHIGIDIVSKVLEAKNLKNIEKGIERVIALVSFCTLVWMSMASYNFMKIELQYGAPVFFNISSGYLVGIIPLGFSAISVRFFNIFIQSFKRQA